MTGGLLSLHVRRSTTRVLKCLAADFFLTYILSMREIKSCIDFVEDVDRRGLDLEESENKRKSQE